VCIASSNAYDPCKDIAKDAVAGNDGVACKKEGIGTDKVECGNVKKGMKAPSAGIMCEFCALGEKGTIVTFDGLFCDGKGKTAGDYNCKSIAGGTAAPADGMYCPIPPPALVNNCEVMNSGAEAKEAGAFFGPTFKGSGNAEKGGKAPSFGVWCEGCGLTAGTDKTEVAPAAGTFWKYDDQTCSVVAKGGKPPGMGMFCKTDKGCVESKATKAVAAAIAALPASATKAEKDVARAKALVTASEKPAAPSKSATSGVATLTVSAAAVLTSLAAMLQ